MIRIERETTGRARVAGSLVGESVRLLRDLTSREAVTLDLSGVGMADESAVRFLAGLSPDRWALVSCPRWLALWVERMRQTSRTRTSR